MAVHSHHVVSFAHAAHGFVLVSGLVSNVLLAQGNPRLERLKAPAGRQLSLIMLALCALLRMARSGEQPEVTRSMQATPMTSCMSTI